MTIKKAGTIQNFNIFQDDAQNTEVVPAIPVWLVTLHRSKYRLRDHRRQLVVTQICSNIDSGELFLEIINDF